MYGLPVGLVVAVADVVFTVSSTSGDEEVVFTFEVVVTVSVEEAGVVGVTSDGGFVGVTTGEGVVEMTSGAAVVGVTTDASVVGVTTDTGVVGVTSDTCAVCVTSGAGVVVVTSGAGVVVVTSDAGVLGLTSDAGVVVVTSGTGVVGVTSGTTIVGVTSDAGVAVVTSDAGVLGVTSDVDVLGVTSDAGVVEVTSDAGVVVVTSDTGVVAVTSGGVTSDAGVVVVTSDADVVGVPSDAGVVGVTADTVVSFSVTSTIVEGEVDSVSESPTVDCSNGSSSLSVDVSYVVAIVLEVVVAISGIVYGKSVDLDIPLASVVTVYLGVVVVEITSINEDAVDFEPVPPPDPHLNVLHVSTAVSESDPVQFSPPYCGRGLVQLLFRVLRRDPPSHDLLQSLQFDQSPEGSHPPSTGQY